jgi:hypothetical protein
MTNQSKTVEEPRLDEAREQGVSWKLWAVPQRAPMGTVREDHSENGDA